MFCQIWCVFPLRSGNKSKIWGCKKDRQQRVCLPAPQVGTKLFLPGWFLRGSRSSLELYLASTRSTPSQDHVWTPHATLIPCWYTVSVMYIAVENHSSSRDAAQLMLMGLEHTIMAVTAKGTLVFLQFLLAQKFFFYFNVFVWRPVKQTRVLLLYSFPLS